MSSVLKRPTQEREGANYPKLSSDLQVARKCTHAHAHMHIHVHTCPTTKKQLNLFTNKGNTC